MTTSEWGAGGYRRFNGHMRVHIIATVRTAFGYFCCVPRNAAITLAEQRRRANPGQDHYCENVGGKCIAQVLVFTIDHLPQNVTVGGQIRILATD